MQTLPRLVSRGGALARAVWWGLACALMIGVCGAMSIGFDQMLLIPSLGPTALLLVLRPQDPTASPLNAVLGHLAAVLAGLLGVAAVGLFDAPDVFATGAIPARIGAVMVGLALIAAAQAVPVLRHPPAASTALLVAVGLMDAPAQLAAVVVGSVVLTGTGLALHRLAGVPVRWVPTPAPRGVGSDDGD